MQNNEFKAVRVNFDAIASLNKSMGHIGKDLDLIKEIPQLDAANDIVLFLDLAKRIETKLKRCIDAELSTLEARNLKPLIIKCSRRIFDTLALIESENTAFNHQVAQHDLQFQTLLEKGFSKEQIGQIISPVNKEAHDFKIAALEAEHKAMQAFVNDYPRYDESIIALFMG